MKAGIGARLVTMEGRDRRRGTRHRLQRRSRRCGAAVAAIARGKAVGEMIANEHRLDRRAAMRALLENRGDLLLVTGLGSTAWDAAAVSDDDRNFYLWGAMGSAAMVGLGLAIARRSAHPRRHRRRRDADGLGRARDDRGAMPAEPRGRCLRQRALRRN